MTTELDFHTEQIRRLGALKFFPTDPKAASELVTALRDVAESEEIARKTIDDFIATSQECPTPADIRRAVFAKQEKPWEPNYENLSKAGSCSVCRSSGMVQQDGKWECCTCAMGQDYPQKLLDMQNAYEARKAITKPSPRIIRPVSEKSMKPVTVEDFNEVLNRAAQGFRERTGIPERTAR